MAVRRKRTNPSPWWGIEGSPKVDTAGSWRGDLHLSLESWERVNFSLETTPKKKRPPTGEYCPFGRMRRKVQGRGCLSGNEKPNYRGVVNADLVLRQGPDKHSRGLALYLKKDGELLTGLLVYYAEGSKAFNPLDSSRRQGGKMQRHNSCIAIKL